MALRGRGVAVLGLLLLVAAACAADGEGERTGGAPMACEFGGSTERSQVEPEGGPFLVSDVRHEVVQARCEERVVFTLEPLPDDAEIGYEVFYRDTPFRGPAGEIDVRGEAVLEVVLPETHPGGDSDVTPPVAEDAELVVDIVKPPEVPGGSLWLIGLKQERPFEVTIQQDPGPALIVTIGAPDGGGTAAEEVPTSETEPQGDRKVLVALEADGRFGTFLQLLKEEAQPRFRSFLSRPDWNHTVVVPTDEAFAALAPGDREEWLDDEAI